MTDTTKQIRDPEDEGKAIVPVPADAPESFFQHQHLGMPKKTWSYHTEDGGLAYVVARYYKGDNKIDLPWTYREYKNGDRDWAAKAIPAPRLLYNLHLLIQNPDKPVLVCEGEKAAEAASALFPEFVCTTSPNGAESADKCDWSPLSGRSVTTWPDNDDSGSDYAKDVSRLCLRNEAESFSIVQVPQDFPEKWDLADDLPEGFSQADLHRLIDEAELIRDPLENLVERAKQNPGEVFKPEVLGALIELRTFDRPAFEDFREALKKVKSVRIGEVDKALKEQSTRSGDAEEESQVDILLRVADEADLFHTPDQQAYGDVVVKGHRETWGIGTKGFKRWLKHAYYCDTGGKAPSAESLNAALGVIEAKAIYEGDERNVHIRVAEHDGKAYIDLCDKDWRVLEIDERGWRILPDAPVRFRRAPGMLPLPEPVQGGSIHLLRKFLNVRDDDGFTLAASWLIAAMRGKGPYPVLVLSGEHGTAKSSFSRFLRGLIDPNESPLRTLREERDMFISANNSHVLAFDNISGMSAATSDTLCRMSTGGSLVTRQLFTDQDEVLMNVIRPIILNGIDDVVTRPDLGDRSLVLILEPIPETCRRPESEINKEYEEARPAILGALLDALSDGLKQLPETKLDSHPRMADFALWATACEVALWGETGAFMAAYEANRADAIDEILEAHPVASSMRQLMEYRPSWTGTAAMLLNALSENAMSAGRLPKTWPDSPRGLSGDLRRIAPFLRKVGIEIIFDKKDNTRNRDRLITISKLPVS